MKKIFFIALFSVATLSQAQVDRRVLKKDTPTKELLKKVDTNNTANVVAASEIEVYISIQKGIYTTDEIYDLLKGENSKLKLFCMSFGVASKLEVKAVNGVFPSLVDNYETIIYKVSIQKPDKPTYIVACIEEQELIDKQAKIEVDYKNEACSGILAKGNLFGIEDSFSGVYKKFDTSEKGCNYINAFSSDKIIKFRISRISHDR